MQKEQFKKCRNGESAAKQMPIHIVEPDLKMCLDAAAIKAKRSFSHADAFAATLTISKKALLITGDDEFESLTGEAEFNVKYII